MLSHALRHAPWLYDLELDDEGWVPLETLVAALREERRFAGLTAADVTATVATASKQRHEIRDGRIRALYGHSVPRRIRREPATPPALLYHGATPKAAGAITTGGLRPMSRQFVHLSVDEETAYAVAARRTPQPVILLVDAAGAAADGVAFYDGGNGKVWLADAVPAQYLDAATPPGR